MFNKRITEKGKWSLTINNFCSLIMNSSPPKSYKQGNQAEKIGLVCIFSLLSFLTWKQLTFVFYLLSIWKIATEHPVVFHFLLLTTCNITTGMHIKHLPRHSSRMKKTILFFNLFTSDNELVDRQLHFHRYFPFAVPTSPSLTAEALY